MDKCLAGDEKNYHAWSHRAAVADAFGLWEGELAAVARLIAADVRNNSAWNHRFTAVSRIVDLCASSCHAHALPGNSRGFWVTSRMCERQDPSSIGAHACPSE